MSWVLFVSSIEFTPCYIQVYMNCEDKDELKDLTEEGFLFLVGRYLNSQTTH